MTFGVEKDRFSFSLIRSISKLLASLLTANNYDDLSTHFAWRRAVLQFFFFIIITILFFTFVITIYLVFIYYLLMQRHLYGIWEKTHLDSLCFFFSFLAVEYINIILLYLRTCISNEYLLCRSCVWWSDIDFCVFWRAFLYFLIVSLVRLSVCCCIMIVDNEISNIP